MIKDYFAVLLSQKDYKELLKDFPETDIMFLYAHLPLVAILEEDSSWLEVFSSNITKIFLKRNTHNRNVIDRFRNKKLIYPSRDQQELYFLK